MVLSEPSINLTNARSRLTYQKDVIFDRRRSHYDLNMRCTFTRVAPFVAAAAEGVSGVILNVFFDTFDRVEWFRSVLSSKPSETV